MRARVRSALPPLYHRRHALRSQPQNATPLTSTAPPPALNFITGHAARQQFYRPRYLRHTGKYEKFELPILQGKAPSQRGLTLDRRDASLYTHMLFIYSHKMILYDMSRASHFIHALKSLAAPLSGRTTYGCRHHLSAAKGQYHTSCYRVERLS